MNMNLFNHLICATFYSTVYKNNFIYFCQKYRKKLDYHPLENKKIILTTGIKFSVSKKNIVYLAQVSVIIL